MAILTTPSTIDITTWMGPKVAPRVPNDFTLEPYRRIVRRPCTRS